MFFLHVVFFSNLITKCKCTDLPYIATEAIKFVNEITTENFKHQQQETVFKLTDCERLKNIS